VVTTYSYVWYTGTNRVQQRTTTLPVISAAQNGSGLAATTGDYYDTYGNLTWHQDERGFLTSTTYDIPTGAISERIDDVNTAMVLSPPGWTTPSGGGLHLVTDYQFDSRGRPTQSLGPSHTISLNGVATSIRRAMWMVYQDATFQTWSAGGYATGSAPTYGYTLINPVSIAVTDSSGKPTASIQATRANTAGALQATDSYPQSSYVRWTTMQYADGFDVSSQRVYKLIPASGTGSSGINYDETDYSFDEMVRQNRVVTPGGTITRTVYEVRNNATQVWVGTNDSGATNSDPSGGGASGNNMVQVTGNQYDNGLGGGDNNVTQATQYVDSTTARVTSYLYDWRDRRTDTDGEVDFYEQICYDNLDRPIRTDRRNITASGNLVARSTTSYDDLGHAYQGVRSAVDPTTGLVGIGLIENAWYDAGGNTLKRQPAGSNTFFKSVYDSAGRLTAQYTGYNLTDSSSANASSVATDTILEQVETTYDAASNVIQVTTRQRYHIATGAGAIGSPSSAQPQARVSYAATWPDALGRAVATADYGTNGGSPLSRPQTIPNSLATVLVTLTTFDSAGNVQTTTDPMGTVTYFAHDAVGREVQRILNFQAHSSSNSSSSSSPASSTASSSSSGGSGPCPVSDDTNITILTAYNGDGNVSSVTAINNATGNQITQYLYGTTLASSGLASNLLKVADVYPDSVGGSDQVIYTYNRQGEAITLSDQNGNIHSYIYDLLGRRTQDCVTAHGSGVDITVLRIQMAYEVRGMLSRVTSYDNATVGSGSVVNDVQLVYNSFGQLIADYQSHSGTVTIGSSPVVQYGYADGSANTIRKTTLTYPNGRVLNYSYSDSDGMNDALSRVSSLIDSDGLTHLADYCYLGMAKIIQENEFQPGLTYTLIGIAGGNDPVTGDIYQGLDLFGRVKDLIWTSTGGSSPSSSSSSGSGVASIVERIQHGYDLAGNRLWRKELADPTETHDELYSYDGLNRLRNMQRGTLNANQASVTANTFAQCWSLDATGNWQNFRQDDDGNGLWDLLQARSANTVNEISLVTNSIGSAWRTPAYDAAGNMITIPQPLTPGASYVALYDSWNRLVSLNSGASQLAGYQYDAMNRRTAKQSYNGGVLTTTRAYYYSAEWQVLEERLLGYANAERQFVWGLGYVDNLLLRDRAPMAGGILTERLHSLQDPNWNTVALTDTRGVVQERYAYDGYGAPSVLTPTFSTRSTTSSDWEIRFSGYRWDQESALYYVRNRLFNPALGCWLTRDPHRYTAGSSSLYEYVSSRPVISVDPYGLTELEDCNRRAAYYGAAAATHPKNKWLKCVSEIGTLVCQLAAACSLPNTRWGDKANWLYCMNKCLFFKWLVTYDATFPEEELLKKTGLKPRDIPPPSPAWKACDAKCWNSSSRECCVEQETAEQKATTECITKCGKYDNLNWGKLFDTPGGVGFGEILKKRFGINLPDYLADYNNFDERVKFGVAICCDGKSE
jgi:RHS repeat-associated protein